MEFHPSSDMCTRLGWPPDHGRTNEEAAEGSASPGVIRLCYTLVNRDPTTLPSNALPGNTKIHTDIYTYTQIHTYRHTQTDTNTHRHPHPANPQHCQAIKNTP